ncbi:conserved hypothetical protein [Vibrio phage 242E40-1]|nr:conserved hypothetical protein [Vibrio phage 242E40-1]
MNDDITAGISIPSGTSVELIVGDDVFYLMDAGSG